MLVEVARHRLPRVGHARPPSRELGELGAQVFLHVHHHRREDAETLYGFATDRGAAASSRRCIGTHGVGPALGARHPVGALARSACAGCSPTDDVAALCLVPGVGQEDRGPAAGRAEEPPRRLPDADARRPASVVAGRRRWCLGARPTCATRSPALGYGPDEIAGRSRDLPDDGDELRAAARRPCSGWRRPDGARRAARPGPDRRRPRAEPVPSRPTGGRARRRAPTPSASLRPRSLDEFVGQAELKEHLRIILEAARRRGQAADHFLFAGPPGLGKTTLAGIVAAEMEVALHITSGPALERAGDLAAILTKLGEGDVLFIDEIHRLSRAVEEVLYPAMEDFQLDIVLGKGPAARSIRLDLPAVHAWSAPPPAPGSSPARCATASASSPGSTTTSPTTCSAIVDAGRRHPRRPTSTPTARCEIARRARGTPRIANRLLRRVRDFAEVRGRRPHRRRRSPSPAWQLFGVDELRPRQGRPGRSCSLAVRALRRRPGRPVHPGHRGVGADRDRRGRLRAVPHPAGPAHAHAAGPGRHHRRPGTTSASSLRPPPTAARDPSLFE